MGNNPVQKLGELLPIIKYWVVSINILEQFHTVHDDYIAMMTNNSTELIITVISNNQYYNASHRHTHTYTEILIIIIFQPPPLNTGWLFHYNSRKL